MALFFRTTVVTVFTTSIFLWCYLADSATVTRFGDGAVSAVYYADKLFTPVATTLIYSISVVLFPKYNQEYSRVSEQEYKKYVGGTVENTLFVILPFSAMFLVFAVPIIHVLFEGGNFNTESTAMTSSVFAMYSLGMAGFCVLDLINKAYDTAEAIASREELVNNILKDANVVLTFDDSCRLTSVYMAPVTASVPVDASLATNLDVTMGLDLKVSGYGTVGAIEVPAEVVSAATPTEESPIPALGNAA